MSRPHGQYLVVCHRGGEGVVHEQVDVIATAINIIRLDAWLTNTPLGETRTSRLARLELAA